MTDRRASLLPPLYGARAFSHAPEHWVHPVPSPRHVSVRFGGETIASSRRVVLLREAGCLPVYYFPPEDVRTDLLEPTERKSRCPYKGEASHWSVRVGEKLAAEAAWSYLEPAKECREIARHFAFRWSRMDAWYEEDEEVFVHPRDPFKRVDVLRSLRHVRIVVGGETVAETRRPFLLFETGHPTRYYLPPEDVRTELLEPSETRTRCPYKGIASYWSVRVGASFFEDLVWSYLDPIPECPKIKGLFCFFNERVDALYVDGALEPPPVTRWSHGVRAGLPDI
jgi:uncharacterized protein (DUF427 family)